MAAIFEWCNKVTHFRASPGRKGRLKMALTFVWAMSARAYSVRIEPFRRPAARNVNKLGESAPGAGMQRPQRVYRGGNSEGPWNYGEGTCSNARMFLMAYDLLLYGDNAS